MVKKGKITVVVIIGNNMIDKASPLNLYHFSNSIYEVVAGKNCKQQTQNKQHGTW